MFVDHCFSFCTFSFGDCNVLSVLRYTDSDYPFGIFKLFLFTNGDCVSKSVTECPSMEINIRHLKVALATILTKQIYVLEIGKYFTLNSLSYHFSPFENKNYHRFIISLQANNLTSFSPYATDLTSDR